MSEESCSEVTYHPSQSFQKSEGEQTQLHFDPLLTKNRRRKSSMVGRNFMMSSCFVHSMLEAQQPKKKLQQQQNNHKQNQTDGEDATHENGSPTIDGPNAEFDEESDPSSRMLTKKQLSDMALGVRELSKHLGNVQMNLPSKSVKLLIVTKLHDKSLIKRTRDMVEWVLSKYPGHVIYIQDIMEKNPDMDISGLMDKHKDFKNRLKYWTHKYCTEHPHLFDLVITLGGDGTVLYASWLFQKVVPPVLSFALGSLGFLTLFDFEHYQRILEEAFTCGVTVALRMRFECTVMRTKKAVDGEKNAHHDLCTEIMEPETDDESTHYPVGSYSVLNELVVDRGPNPTMSSTELFGDEEHLTTIQADGICIATPTGSTAYSLAAGGSLSHPDNPVMLVSPICAHSLSFRPVILPDSMVLRVGVPYDSRTTAWASFDGKERVELQQGDYVTIAASRFPFATIRYKKQQSDFFTSLSRTLQWNSRSAKQKAFDSME